VVLKKLSAIAEVIKGAKAEGKVVGVADAGMAVNNIDRYKQFASQGVQLLSVGAQESGAATSF